MARSHRRISRPGKNNGGCLWGLFRMFDFNQARNSPRLLSNREHGNGRIDVADRYSSDALDLQSDFAEEDTGYSLRGQDEAENDDSRGYIRVMDETSEVQQAEHSSLAKNKQMLAFSGCEDPSRNIINTNNFTGIVSHLDDADDLAALTHYDSSTCPLHSLTERFCDDLELATLLQDFFDEKNKDRGVECRKNSLLSASINTQFRELDTPDPPDAKMDHSGHFLSDICDKLFHMEEMNTHEALHQSDEIINTLKMLGSNKELLYKLLQDPNSNLTKPLQKLQNSRVVVWETVSDKPLRKQNAHNSLSKDKISEIQKPKDPVKRIVVLKPIPSRREGLSIASSSISTSPSSYSTRTNAGSRRASFHFSFQEMKRRLRQVMGERKKERNGTSSGRDIRESSHGFFSGSPTLSDGVQTHLSALNSCSTKNGDGAKRQYKKEKPKGYNADIDLGTALVKNRDKKTVCILERESNFQREAKKHLIEMLHSKGDCEHPPEKEVSKALWNILSFQEYNFSPGYSPRRLTESSLSPPQMRFSPLWSPSLRQSSERLSLLRHNSDCSDCSSANADAEPHVLDLSSERIVAKLEDENCTMKVACLEGLTDIVDTNKLFETTNPVDEISDNNSHGMAELDEIHADDETRSPRLDIPMEIKSSTPSIPPSILLIHGTEAPEIIMEKLERPSPVSILIPPFVDDTTSSSSPVSEQREDVGLPMSPRELHFDDCDKTEALITSCFERDPQTLMGEEEFKLEYVESLLEASGLMHIETWERRQSLHNLLNPSLFDELEIPFGDIPHDLMLLFDCISEILEGIREKFFPRRPWAAFVKPNVRPFPCWDSLIREVCEKTTCQHATQSRSSLNQVIEKDLDMIIWMDTSVEIDDMGIAVEDEIFEEVLEEVVFDICLTCKQCSRACGRL